VIQEAAGGATVEAPIYQCIEREWGDVKASEEGWESTIRGGGKMKESANEEK